MALTLGHPRRNSVTVRESRDSVSVPPATIDSGQSVTLTAIPSGGSGSYSSYAWYQGGSCAGTVVGTSASYSTGALASTTTYCVLVTDSVGDTAISTVTIVVNPGLAAGTIAPSRPGIDDGQSITLTANPSGGSGPYTYQWYTGAGCADPILGADGQTYSVSPSSSTTYFVKVTGSHSETACSAGDQVSVAPPMSVPVISASSGSVDSGLALSLSVVTPPTGGVPPYACQWLQKAPNASSFSSLGGQFTVGCGSSGISTGALSVAGTWHFELRVTDSALAPVAVTWT